MTSTQLQSAEKVAPRDKRLDVQGLRALAVLLVIANHVWGAPTGGYIGVDIFFVVSGYVITRLLQRELRKTDRISFRAFYIRRIKRITPAAVTVLVTCVAVGSVLFSEPRERALQTDALWAALLGANWHSIILGTDYMHATDVPSAIQHYWSLAVEEQFYLVWPVLLLVVWRMTRRRRTSIRTVSVLLFVAVSLTWSAWEVAHHPTVAYFSTESRAWELGVGALIAHGDTVWRRLPSRLRAPLAWVGLSVIAAVSFGFSSSTSFPGPSALAPVLATGAVLIAGEGGTSHVLPLTNRVSSYIGDISYSLYLWHFPILTFVAVLHPQLGKSYVAWTLALTLAASVLTYHLVENPLRHVSFQRVRARPHLARGSRARVASGPRWKRPLLGGIGVATVLLTSATFVTRSPIQASATPLSEKVSAAELTPQLSTRSAAISAAMAQPTWPRLQVPVSNLDGHRAPQWTTDGCLGGAVHALTGPMKNALRCVYGNKGSKKVLALLGDSTAISYLPGIIPALGATWRIEVYTEYQCPAVYIKVRLGTGEPHPDCRKFQQDVARHLGSTRPTEIVLTSSPETFARLQSNATGPAAEAEWRAATAETLRALRPDASRIVFMDPPPELPVVQDCSPVDRPGYCTTTVEPYEKEESGAQHAASAGQPDVVVVPTVFWYCTSQGVCPPYVGSNAQTVDGRHLVDEQAASLAPLIRVTLDPDSQRAKP